MDNPAPMQAAAPAPFDGQRWSRSLPHSPGVYRYYDANDRLLYVGKARDLNKRTSSYFRDHLDDARIASMVQQIARAEFVVVDSEVDALVLESRLIKEEHPHYNIRLRDGSGYPYLHLSTHKKAPQLTLHRGRKGKEGRYFGPYPSRDAARQAHDLLQKHFGLRTCSDSFFAHRIRPCLEYQIGRCSAPCTGVISMEDYQERVAELTAFLDGRSEDLVRQLRVRMDEAAQATDYEAAARWRDRIAALGQVQARLVVEAGEGAFDALSCAIEQDLACISIVVVRAGQVVGMRSVRMEVPAGVDCPGLLEHFIAQHYLVGEAPVPKELLVAPALADKQAMEQALGAKMGHRISIVSNPRAERRMQLRLAETNAQAALAAALQSDSLLQKRRQALAALLGLETLPGRIECFDISHTQGESAVASCVVFGPEGAMKSAYRRYNIQGITPGDDYAAIAQAVERRLTGGTPPPDVMLIDGGAGQVAEAVRVARGLMFTFPIVGVSKGPDRRPGEEALIMDDGRKSLRPGSHSPALHLIQAVRDEAHRFALRGHRTRREATRMKSPLEGIPGVGASRRKALLTSFGGLDGLKKAAVDDIARVPGIGRTLATTIRDALAGGSKR